jgi:hypothetical protein
MFDVAQVGVKAGPCMTHAMLLDVQLISPTLRPNAAKIETSSTVMFQTHAKTCALLFRCTGKGGRVRKRPRI